MATPSESSTPTAVSSTPPKSHRWVYVVAAVGIAAIVVGSVLWYEYEPGGPLNPHTANVTEVIWLHDGALFESQPGFTRNANTGVALALRLHCSPINGASENCTSGYVYVETPGFILTWTNAPFQWSSGLTGAGFTLRVNLTTPSTSYTGYLKIDFQ